MVKFRQKQYTQWDETDQLKQMKDADILAEKKRSNSGMNRVGAATTLLGGTVGTIGGAILGKKAGRLGGKILGKTGGKILGGLGAIGGAVTGGVTGSAVTASGTYLAQSKKRSENNFYNDRLEYAQRQARRREKKDWKQNMTGREGYTY